MFASACQWMKQADSTRHSSHGCMHECLLDSYEEWSLALSLPAGPAAICGMHLCQCSLHFYVRVQSIRLATFLGFTELDFGSTHDITIMQLYLPNLEFSNKGSLRACTCRGLCRLAYFVCILRANAGAIGGVSTRWDRFRNPAVDA